MAKQNYTKGTDNSTSRAALKPKPKRFDGRVLSAKTPSSKSETKYTKASSSSVKEGNKITSTTQRYMKPEYSGYGGPTQYTQRETTLGKGGRRESTVTRKSTGYSEKLPTYYIDDKGRKVNDFETYSTMRGKRVVSEVQHNRGSGTRKTGSKNKGF